MSVMMKRSDCDFSFTNLPPRTCADVSRDGKFLRVAALDVIWSHDMAHFSVKLGAVRIIIKEIAVVSQN